MSNIRFNASKKATITLLFILFLIVGGTGGYLLWRVNQEKSLGSGRSEAGTARCCCPDGGATNPKLNCGTPGAYYSLPCGCDIGNWCYTVPECNEIPGRECDEGQDCNSKTHCCWPEVAYCNYDGQCECKSPPNYCNDKTPQCTPTCPPGYEKCSGANCVGDVVDVDCVHYCASCNNKYHVCEKCVKIQVAPTCGDGTVNQSSEQCDPPNSACTTSDGHTGKCSSTCTCTANPYCGDGVKNNNEQCDPPDSACTTTEGRAGVCSSSCTCTANPYCGDGKLDSGEKCEQGNPAGVSCTWDKCNQEACACLPADLVILKSGVEQCVNEGTAEVSSTITYTISIKNNGKGDGKITKIEDTLDQKVVSGNLTPKDISDGGKYSNGKITWDFTSPLVVEAGKSKLITYKLDVDKENFGTYNNSVVVFPEEGPAKQPISAQVIVDCKANEPVPEGTVPETGIFDDSRNIVIMGAILLFVGLGWSWITESLITVRSKMLENNRSRFEKRISKR